jgi:phosphoadenosine phosphosulfate reductase
MNLQQKIDTAIELLRKTEKLALQYSEDGFHLAFSGGKDSQVIYELAKMAGVKFYAQMQITTLDPPELLKFIRTHYSDVIFEHPKMNFFELIKHKKMLPTMKCRYCCSFLKEKAGSGKVTILGVRKAESARRSKRNEIELQGHKFSGTIDEFEIAQQEKIVCVGGKDKILLSPIIDWKTSDVWNFIHRFKLPYCSIYDKGRTRIGCVFCPMSSVKNKQKDKIEFPKIERKIKQSIQFLIQNGYMDRFIAKYNITADEIFNWWISNENTDTYFRKLRTQTKIEFE